MKSLKSRPTTTTGTVPTDDALREPADGISARRQHRRKRGDHRGDLAPEERQDGRQRADVQRHVERQAEVGGHVPPEERARQNQVGRARNRQELGESLQIPSRTAAAALTEADGAGAYDARRRPGFRLSGARGRPVP